MKESYGKDPASHPDPESCVGGRKDAGEALTGAHAGQPSSCEIRSSGVPTPLSEAEGNTEGGDTGEPIVVLDPQSAAAKAFQELAVQIARQVESGLAGHTHGEPEHAHIH